MIEAPANDKSVKFCRNWQKHRQGGVFRFVLLWGLLGWGVTNLIMLEIIIPYMEGLDKAFPDLTTILIHILVGLLWGFFMWHIMEWRFAKETKKCNFCEEDTKTDA